MKNRLFKKCSYCNGTGTIKSEVLTSAPAVMRCALCNGRKKVRRFVQRQSIILGCDPEIFLSRDGKVIGAEKVLPKGGINFIRGRTDTQNKIIIDGVQAEINPSPSSCRQTLSLNIAACFAELNKHINKVGNVKVDFSQTVEVGKKEMDSLSDDAKKLGCMPSINNYSSKAKISDAAQQSLARSCGGHIHIGIDKPLVAPERMVPMLDLIVANTFVLIDRDPGNAKRRETYGRAGEYRLPKHGIEYRTLSNFWLTSYPLASLAFGLSRFAVSIVTSGILSKDTVLENSFMRRVTRTDLKNAINNNDYKLAMKNFSAIERPLREFSTSGDPLTDATIDSFLYFVRKTNSHGIKYWFPQDPMKHWLSINNTANLGYGWEAFLHNRVVADMNKKIQT